MRDWKFITGIAGLLLATGLQVSSIINMPLAIALWTAAVILLLWRFAKRVVIWLKPQGLARTKKSLYFQVGETAYLTSHPYTEDSEVQSIISQVTIGNPNKGAKTIISFRLEYKSKAPYLISEARESKDGGSFLVPAGGGFSSVPRKPYLNLPIIIKPNDGVVGWIGFTMIQRKDLTLAEGWSKQAELVAVLHDGTEFRTKFPTCDLPPAQSP